MGHFAWQNACKRLILLCYYCFYKSNTTTHLSPIMSHFRKYKVKST